MEFLVMVFVIPFGFIAVVLTVEGIVKLLLR